mmetsp:Transcript_95627/g.205190  ORF Transcript_95627/g.205190 Transcript_95627/m.205190 type:complete len:232 (+) Transcript_95627:19-714(+)
MKEEEPPIGGGHALQLRRAIEDHVDEGPGGDHGNLSRHGPAIRWAYAVEEVPYQAAHQATTCVPNDTQRVDESTQGVGKTCVLEVHCRKGHCCARNCPEDTLRNDHRESWHPHEPHNLPHLLREAEALWPPKPRLLLDEEHHSEHDKQAQHADYGEGYTPTVDAVELLVRYRRHEEASYDLSKVGEEEQPPKDAAPLVLLTQLHDEGLHNRQQHGDSSTVDNPEEGHEAKA